DGLSTLARGDRRTCRHGARAAHATAFRCGDGGCRGIRSMEGLTSARPGKFGNNRIRNGQFCESISRFKSRCEKTILRSSTKNLFATLSAPSSRSVHPTGMEASEGYPAVPVDEHHM